MNKVNIFLTSSFFVLFFIWLFLGAKQTLAQACSFCDPYGNCVWSHPPACEDQECSSSADCGGPPSGCTTDADCPAGYYCNIFGNCRPIGPTPTSEPPDPTGPPKVTPTETPPEPPVSGQARPRYTPAQQYPFPCNLTAPGSSIPYGDLEFHSLRPYQESPCNPNYADLALFCGNDLVLTQDEVILKNFYPSLKNWTYSWIIRYVSGGYESQQIYPVPPEVPVLGQACSYCQNGACIHNYGGSCDPGTDICSNDIDCVGPGLSDCLDNGDGTETCYFNIERVRDIAVDLEGAYLPIMGFTEPSVGSESRPDRVTNAYSQDENMDDARKVNEYVSWYLNGINNRAEYAPPDPDTEEGRRRIIDFSGPLKKLLAKQSQVTIRKSEISDAGDVRHNQVVGCRNLLGQPTNCYPARAGVSRVRLSDLAGNDGSDRLFQNIPFSSTEDRKGRVELGSYSIQPALSSKFRILWSQITNQVPAVLFFAHMQEASELAAIFQSIFSYQGANLSAEPEPAVVSTSAFCDLRGIRSNPGDNLFPGELSATVSYGAQVECEFAIPDPDIPGNLCRRLTDFEADCVSDSLWCDKSYVNHDCADGQQCGVGCSPPISQSCDPVPPLLFGGPFSCFPSSWGCEDVGGGCPGGYDCADENACSQPHTQIPLVQECKNAVYVSFRTNTLTPLANDVWARLVANPVSVFRRLFPKIEDDVSRPIKRLWDMPAATSVTYQASGVTVVAGNPGSGRPANQAELYFPHIGGIHEYFLKCIQKTLRPQGFGEGCISGPEPLAGLSSGTCGTPPPDGAIAPSAGTCQIGTGLCSPDYLSQWFDGCHARQASIVCNVESGGNPSALNCGCFSGTSVDYSVGLFQINLLAHCDAAMSYTWDPPSCSVLDQAQIDECLANFFDAGANAEYAAQLSNGGANWTPWSAYTVACRKQVDDQCP